MKIIKKYVLVGILIDRLSNRDLKIKYYFSTVKILLNRKPFNCLIVKIENTNYIRQNNV